MSAARIHFEKRTTNFVIRHSMTWVMVALGDCTTFATFSLQTPKLFHAGSTGLAMLNVALSILLCLLGVWLGHCAGKALAG
jgi:CrcB protein